MAEEVKVIIGIIIMVVVLFVGVGFGANALEGQQCIARWETKFSPEYDFIKGCTIIVNGTRIPSSSYRVL